MPVFLLCLVVALVAVPFLGNVHDLGGVTTAAIALAVIAVGAVWEFLLRPLVNASLDGINHTLGGDSPEGG